MYKGIPYHLNSSAPVAFLKYADWEFTLSTLCTCELLTSVSWFPLFYKHNKFVQRQTV
jgi:hypothetical protein